MIFPQEILDDVKVLVTDGEADGRLGVGGLEFRRGAALDELFDDIQVAVLTAVVKSRQTVLPVQTADQGYRQTPTARATDQTQATKAEHRTSTEYEPVVNGW